MNSKLGLTRTVVRPHYALIAPDGHVASVLPGWTDCTPCVLLSGALGAGLVQMLIDLKAGGRGLLSTGADEWFLYLVAGRGELNERPLEPGGFGYLPPGARLDFLSKSDGTQLLAFRKKYAPLDQHAPPTFFTAHERTVPESPFLGDPRARLKTLLPDTPGADMAVNLFTYDPGATLPFVETHLMEHGMLFLSGSGVYRLGDDWHPVTAGDALWIAPYCPQWFIAAGPEPARYIYYKDVNRTPP
jgi:(S)-ureidoglycine aminohydrolase